MPFALLARRGRRSTGAGVGGGAGAVVIVCGSVVVRVVVGSIAVRICQESECNSIQARNHELFDVLTVIRGTGGGVGTTWGIVVISLAVGAAVSRSTRHDGYVLKRINLLWTF